jgi:hypothetical protein
MLVNRNVKNFYSVGGGQAEIADARAGIVCRIGVKTPDAAGKLPGD